jgi:hypothetical protein
MGSRIDGSDDLEARARRLLAGPGNKRVEIMVSGCLDRLGTVRKSLEQVRRRLVDEARRSGGKLARRVTPLPSSNGISL